MTARYYRSGAARSCSGTFPEQSAAAAQHHHRPAPQGMSCMVCAYCCTGGVATEGVVWYEPCAVYVSVTVIETKGSYTVRMQSTVKTYAHKTILGAIHTPIHTATYAHTTRRRWRLLGSMSLERCSGQGSTSLPSPPRITPGGRLRDHSTRSRCIGSFI